MTARIDILDEPEPLKRSLVGSVVLHAGVVVLLLTADLVGGRKPEQWGDPTGGAMGSVAVNPVAKIPLPERNGPVNPVANDTESQVPAPPPVKTKALPKVKAPDPDAIPIKGRNAKKTTTQAYSPLNKWQEKQEYRPNQVFSPGGQAANTPMYGLQGGGGVGVGTNSPFGTQLGWYATTLRDAIARKWTTADVNPRLTTAPPVVLTFTLRRDGSVAPGSIRIAQTSGDRALDFSARRAVEDASPFPAIPSQFPRNEAEIEFQFVLKR
jgi:protein TonB